MLAAYLQNDTLFTHQVSKSSGIAVSCHPRISAEKHPTPRPKLLSETTYRITFRTFHILLALAVVSKYLSTRTCVEIHGNSSTSTPTPDIFNIPNPTLYIFFADLRLVHFYKSTQKIVSLQSVVNVITALTEGNQLCGSPSRRKTYSFL